MNIFYLILIIFFVALAIYDTVLTYRCIKKGKGHEAKPFKWKGMAALYIKSKFWTIVITVLAVLLILGMVIESGFYLLLIPVDLFFAWICRHNWRILKG